MLLCDKQNKNYMNMCHAVSYFELSLQNHKKYKKNQCIILHGINISNNSIYS